MPGGHAPHGAWRARTSCGLGTRSRVTHRPVDDGAMRWLGVILQNQRQRVNPYYTPVLGRGAQPPGQGGAWGGREGAATSRGGKCVCVYLRVWCVCVSCCVCLCVHICVCDMVCACGVSVCLCEMLCVSLCVCVCVCACTNGHASTGWEEELGAPVSSLAVRTRCVHF